MNLFEESKLNGPGISLVLLFAVLVCSLFFIALSPQGGDYSKERWAKKQANKKAASRRAGKAAAAHKSRSDEEKVQRKKSSSIEAFGFAGV